MKKSVAKSVAMFTAGKHKEFKGNLWYLLISGSINETCDNIYFF